jgi:hypothetical protein
MIFIRGLQGILVSMTISYTIFMVNAVGDSGFTATSNEIVYQYVLAVVVGFWMAASTVIYEIDDWSILRQTMLHALILSPYIPFAFIVGWAPNNLIGGIIYVIAYIIIFILIWLSFKQYYIKKAKELNQKLSQRNK